MFCVCEKYNWSHLENSSKTRGNLKPVLILIMFKSKFLTSVLFDGLFSEWEVSLFLYLLLLFSHKGTNLDFLNLLVSLDFLSLCEVWGRLVIKTAHAEKRAALFLSIL